MDKTSLGDRMKAYESVPKNFLMRKTPCIIRLDGKAFHTFTKGFDKPFDVIIEKTMKETMLYLCKNIQGCVLGYTQSDEITLVLCDYQKPDTSAWFDYNVQKVVSISAAMATSSFSRIMYDIIRLVPNTHKVDMIKQKLENGVFFDSRCFSLPRYEVVNCLIWRQQDATRNSIQALAQSLFSHKECQNKNCNILQDMIFTQKGINWNDLPIYRKRGACCIKKEKQKEVTDVKTGETRNITIMDWVVDDNIPIFTQDRNYIESRISFEEN